MEKSSIFALTTTKPQDNLPAPNRSLVLSPTQALEAEEMAAQVDFATLSPAEIAKVGLDEGRGFQDTLDDFLERLGGDRADKLYDLCEQLNSGVADAELPALYEEIVNQQKNSGWRWWVNPWNWGRGALQAARQAHQETVKRTTEKTTQLSRLMADMESQLTHEVHNLTLGLNELDALKKSYSLHAANFAVVVSAAQLMLAKARQLVADKETEVAKTPDALVQADLQDLKNKLQLLESQALALEGAYSRLPADRLVIQQIQNAGLTTLQEVIITATSRFNSIKMTLLTLRGLLDVQGVQAIAQRQATMDRQLESIRRAVGQKVVLTAAVTPGNNRLEQATQIMQIVDDNRSMQEAVQKGRFDNQEKFAKARQILAEARQGMATLHLAAPNKEKK